jgi:glyoxylase-like metal-dependent hydrolase (beta-lactamase superfamily II)
MDAGNIEFYNIPTQPNELPSYVTAIHTGAHCPQHCAYLFNFAGYNPIFFGGDVVPQLRQLKTKIITKYDFDGKLAMELRQQYKQQGIAQNWEFLFYHDVHNPTAKSTQLI